MNPSSHSTSTMVSALQPALNLNAANPRTNNNIKSATSSTALDYVATPETETESSSSNSKNQDQQQLQKLEQLLRLEFSLEQTGHTNTNTNDSMHPNRNNNNNNKLGWTVISATLPKHPRALKTVPQKKSTKKLHQPELQVKQEQQAAIQVVNQPKKKKRVTLVQKAQRKVPTRTAPSTTTATTASSSKSTSPSRGSSKALNLPRRPATTTATLSNNKRPSSKDSVYWLRTPSSKNASQQTPLLTRQEEITLTQQIRALRQAEQVRDEYLMASHDADLTEAQWAAKCGFANPLELRRVLRQGQEAQTRLVQANMGLVTSIAKRHYASLKYALEAGGGVGTILTLQDCLQEGQIGLMAAAERFDAERNVRFSTYATWWIRQRILRGISDSSRIIRLPAYVHSMLMKIRKAKYQMQQEIGRVPSTPELAHFMEMTVEKLQQYTQSSRNVVSLENPLRPTNSGKGDGLDVRTLADTIASDAPTPLEDAQRIALRQDLDQLLNDALTTTERAVLLTRYGLEDGHSKTLEETSRHLGVSRERVRLVEARALNILRSPQKNYRLKTHLGGSLGTSHGNQKGSLGRKKLKAKTVSTSSRKAPRSRLATKKTKKAPSPFASSLPFDYAAASASGRPSKQGSQEMTLEQSKSEEPSPDRMWFF